MPRQKQPTTNKQTPNKPSYEMLELEIKHLNGMIAELSQKIAGHSVDLAHAQTFGKRMEQQAQIYQERLQKLESEGPKE